MVSFICVVAFKGSLVPASSTTHCDITCQVAADKMRRTIAAFGVFPALCALYFRLTIPETPRYTMDMSLDLEKAKADTDAYLSRKIAGAEISDEHFVVVAARQKAAGPKATWKEFWLHFMHWRYGKILLGTAGS